MAVKVPLGAPFVELFALRVFLLPRVDWMERHIFSKEKITDMGGYCCRKICVVDGIS